MSVLFPGIDRFEHSYFKEYIRVIVHAVVFLGIYNKVLSLD